MLPNWDQGVLDEPRTRELWWRGIPPRIRGLVWQRAVRNELELTENSFRAALKRAKDVERPPSRGNAGVSSSSSSKTTTNGTMDRQTQSTPARGLSPLPRRKEEDWFDAIRRDALATFPELRIFQPDRPLHQALVDVLMAYSMYRSDVGYIYGTNVSFHFRFLSMRPVSRKPLAYLSAWVCICIYRHLIDSFPFTVPLLALDRSRSVEPEPGLATNDGC